MPTVFPQRARRDDPNGHMVVQNNLDFLKDAVDEVVGKVKTGTATIPNGASVVTVTHGLTISSASIAVTPIGDLGAGVRFWIAGKTTTSFEIHTSANAPVAGFPFDWTVRGA